ncbi:formimidoylglutamate deiminase [soil metagenome]
MTAYVGNGTRITEVDGVIVSVETFVTPESGDIQLPGVLLPGFANAHSHAFHRALRGRTHAGGGTFWTWRETMYDVAARLTPDRYFELASAVFAEMLLAGYTVVGEFHYLHDAGMDDAILAAAAAAGIRMSLLDALYLDTSAHPVQTRFSDGTLDSYLARHAALRPPSSKTRVLTAVHSVRAVDPRMLRELTPEFSRGGMHAHVSEQPAENAWALERFGRTPVQLFADAGLVGPDFTAVHATHLTPGDIRALRGSAVCFCPTTERDLADGIGPAFALHAAGVRLCLGSDQNAVIDPFEELRGLELDERLASGERGRFRPDELTDAATANGYASLGWAGGRLEPGQLCDFIAVDAASVRTAGALQLGFAATGADVTHVVVGGELVVRDRQHALGDVAGRLEREISWLFS